MPTTEQLDSWWSQTPDANVALVLGRGKFAVDLDGGADAEQLLADAGIALPLDAPRSKTGGGYHVFLSSYNPVPDRIGLFSTDGHKPQVDIRGIGIVVVPPSIHPNGATYQWLTPLTSEPPRAPQNLLGSIATHRTAQSTDAPIADSSKPKFWVVDALRGVGEGKRDAICTQLAGFLLGKGLDEDTTIAILAASFGPSCTPPFPVRDIEKCVRSIRRRQITEGEDRHGVEPVHVSAVLEEFRQVLEQGAPPTLATPFPVLNNFLNGGFSPGELIFLGARPGIGKTALGLEMARHAARESGGAATLVVSREMTNLALVRRLVAQDGRILASRLKTGSLSFLDRDLFEESSTRLGGLPLFLIDNAVSLGEIMLVVSAIAEQVRIAFLVVDYLQLIRAPKEIKERRHQVEAVSQGLKLIAQQYRIPVLCLSSLARPNDGDRDKPPTLSSLRESGELEHDADVILLLHRKYHEPQTSCNVAKNRDGRLGTVHLTFHHEYVAFEQSLSQNSEN